MRASDKRSAGPAEAPEPPKGDVGPRGAGKGGVGGVVGVEGDVGLRGVGEGGLMASGYRVMRVTWRQLRYEPLLVTAMLAGALSDTPAGP